MNHHYVPQFYLKQWAEADGRLPYYRWIKGHAVPGRIAPRSTAYEPDLYARTKVPTDERHVVETHFFSKLDSKASIIHGRLMRQERFTFTAEERTDWAIFLAAANARTPDMITFIKENAERTLRENLDSDPEEVEKRLGYKPPYTLSEWTEKNRPDVLANFGLHILIKYLTREDLIQPFMDMEWSVHGIPGAANEFLTCDRPFWYFENPKHPKFSMMMTLSPRVVFIASRTAELGTNIASQSHSMVARRVNESVFSRALERVYGRAKLEYVNKLFRLSQRKKAP